MSGQGDDLTLAEAVPLATVLLQRLLADAGVRSLAIKGPAFVDLGVRAPKQSNDVDLLIHPDDRGDAGDALISAGWSRMTWEYPIELDRLHHAATWKHQYLPCTLDLHHHFPGFLGPVGEAFGSLWVERSQVTLGQQSLVTTSTDHGMVIEGLHLLRATPERGWVEAGARIARSVRLAGISAARLRLAARALGAERPLVPVFAALGDHEEVTSFDFALFEEWRRQCGPRRPGDRVWAYLRVAPGDSPYLLYRQIFLSEDRANAWAQAKGLPFHSRKQVMWLRGAAALRTLLRRE